MKINSLRLQLLAWVVLPLAGLATINLWTSHGSALATANLVTDRMLLGSARTIAGTSTLDSIPTTNHATRRCIRFPPLTVLRPSSAGMERAVNFLEIGPVEMGVDHRGRHRRVSEQLLDHAQISSSL